VAAARTSRSACLPTRAGDDSDEKDENVEDRVEENDDGIEENDDNCRPPAPCREMVVATLVRPRTQPRRAPLECAFEARTG
jgi:hypothetical protein